LYQFNIVFGILIAYLSNYFIGQFMGENAWRYMLGVEAIPAIIYTIMVLGVPNSPRWLMMKQQGAEKVKALLMQLNPGADIKTELQAITDSLSVGKREAFFSGKFSKSIWLAFLLAFFNQASGINFVLYYAPRIFEQAGIAADNVLGASIPIGVVNFIFTLLGMYLIDRAGRKTLMIIGSIGYILTLLGVAWAFSTGAQGIIVVALVSAFVASHAIGQGAVIWVFISEIFPNSVRDSGMSWGSGTHWVFAAIITMITLPVLETFSASTVFLFFAAMMVLQLIWVLVKMPETKGVSLEELERKLTS